MIRQINIKFKTENFIREVENIDLPCIKCQSRSYRFILIGSFKGKEGVSKSLSLIMECIPCRYWVGPYLHVFEEKGEIKG